jgi:hypothetical protein
MAGEISPALRASVAARAYHVCEYCLLHEDNSYLDFEVDHIISLKHEGLTALDNLAYTGFHCNRHKGSDLGSLARRTRLLTRFYNPRTDHWADHFDLQDGRIESLTDIGEVTVRVLDLNHPNRLLRRQILADAGRYPTVEALARMKE